MKDSRRSSYLALAFVFVLAASGFGVMAWEDYRFLRECQSTIGRVVEVERKKSESSKAAGDYFLTTFSYEVGEDVYRNQQKLDTPPSPGPATVYYLPAEPLKSRLDLPSPAGDMLITFACAVGAVGFGRKSFGKRVRSAPSRLSVTKK